MTSLMIASVVFTSLMALVLAAGMALRDMRLAEATEAMPVGLKRPVTSADYGAPASLIQRINFGFDRLVLESGTGVGAFAALLLMILSGVVLGGIVLLFENDPVTALLSAIAGLLIPLAVLAFKRRRQLELIEEQIPEVLALMSRAIHAGETMEQAVALAGDETSAPMGPELSTCARQIGLGMSVSKAMESLGKRVRISDIRVLSSVLAVHRHSGGNLASTLEHFSEVARSRASHRRHLRSATAAGRLSAQFIGAVGPLLFVFLFFFKRDHLMPLLEQPVGNGLLLAAAVLEIVGLLWLVHMLRSQNQ